MRKIYFFIIACLLTETFSAQSVRELCVLHTNDTHSRIEPFALYYPDTLMAGKGGFVRRVTFIKQERKKCKDLLLFDCGDFSQGSPYYNLFKGETEVKLMNEMGYDAGTIGNHEFDFGLENMARLFKLAHFPIVCANYDVKGTVLEGLVKEFVILKRNGLKIGVFGLGAQLDGLVSKENYGNVKFEEPVSEAQRITDLLRKEKKWSQFELAEQADISEQTINSIESRRLWPSDKTLAKITDALDTDISRLFLPDCSTEFPGRELPEDLCTAVVQSVRNLVEATLQQYTK